MVRNLSWNDAVTLLRAARLLLLALALVGDVAHSPSRIVTWSTGNEIDVAGYIVERADSQAGPWERASGLIVAQEDVLAWNDYRFVDRTAEDGEHWHRLVVVNLKNEKATLGTIAP